MELRQKTKRLKFSSLMVALVSVANATSALGSGVSVIRRPALQAPILSTLRIFALRIMQTQVELHSCLL